MNKGDQMYTVGKIFNTHGIKGEVKVKRITDFTDRFEVGNTLYSSDESGKQIPLEIDGHRIHKGIDLLHFKGYDSIEMVEHFKGYELMIKEEQQTALEAHEYYYHEIIGCKTITTSGDELGIITSILAPGANDVWIVETASGKEILIPYIEDVVKKVNVKEKTVVIELMEGLIE